jgi:hypothetical protein
MTKKYILGNNCCRVLLCSNHLHSLLQCNSHMEMGVCIDPLMKRWHYVQALSLQLHKCIITAYIIKNGKFLQEYKCLDRCEIKKLSCGCLTNIWRCLFILAAVPEYGKVNDPLDCTCFIFVCGVSRDTALDTGFFAHQPSIRHIVA